MVARGYKDTEIGVIPIEWDVVQLTKIAPHISYGLTVRPKYIKEGIPLISAKEIKGGLIDYNNAPKISNEDFNKLSNKAKPIKGDIFLSKTGTIGRVAYVQSEKLIAITQNIAIIRLDGKINSQKFIVHYMKTDMFQKMAMKKVNQSTIMDLQLQDIRKLLVPLPPLIEQEKIADILSTADNKIDAIAIQIKKAETLKKGLLQKLLSEGIGHNKFKDSELGKIPASWEVIRLDKLIETKYITSHLDGNHGGLYPKQSEFVESGTPYLSANMIKGNHIDFSLAKFLTKERASKFRKGVAKDKDVLFAHNATVGPVTLLKTNLDYVILSTTLTYYRCDLEKLNNYYLMNYIKSIYFINQYEKFMKQSTRNQIPITQQRQLYFIIPPLEEQKQIADILSTADEKLEVLRAKKEKYETLKKGLFQKLLSGEIRV